jgi:hypothetical protein
MLTLKLTIQGAVHKERHSREGCQQVFNQQSLNTEKCDFRFDLFLKLKKLKHSKDTNFLYKWGTPQVSVHKFGTQKRRFKAI